MSRNRAAFLARLEHPVDTFQIAAMDSIDADASVLVAAPTGSGKTLIAEYAIETALAAGRRAFYTAPLKALSNQKFRDFTALYGADTVGLLTGDNAINPDGRVVVMTTEVLRNMIYGSHHRLEDLGVVVLDEVHFLQDAYRGPVWEEVIIQLDPVVQLVCLSATVSNAGEVGEWLTTVRGRTDVIVETHRPVDLVNHYAFKDRATGQVVMHESVVGGRANDRLSRLLVGSQTARNRQGGPRGRGGRFLTPLRTEIVDLLESRGMLPAIVFIFSRAQCEDAVASCVRDGVCLTDAEEEDRIVAIVEDHCASLTDDDRDALGYDTFLDVVCTGVASHHAGMIPMFKEAVEECFVRGLIKVVFATETLAVGINMPARAVVIEKLTKFTGEHHTLLRASEFTQLTGRAGRRGLDDIGHAITLWNPWVTYDQVVGLATSRTFRLTSAFRPTFNMAVNMVRSHTREGVTHLLNLSFAQFQADKDVVTTEAQLEARRRELARLGDSVVGDGQDDARDNAVGASDVEAEIALRSLRPGDVVVFDAANIRGRGLVLSTASRRTGTRLTVLTPSRKQIDVTARDLRALPYRGARVDLPVPFEPNRAEFVREACQRLVRARVEQAESRMLENAPADRRSVDPAARAKRLRREIDQIEKRASNRAGSVGARFIDVVDLLEEMGYVDGWALTEKGRTLGGIFHECDLLIVETVTRGVLNGLSETDLVAVVSSLVYEPRSVLANEGVRWPNDTVRQRCRRIEKVSQDIQERERSRGLLVHRAPHAGLAWEASRWADGSPLSRIVDDELTPGDFVRTMRQMIDLLRQVGLVAPAQVAEACEGAVRRINRGVVASAMGEASR